ncbi:MAG: TetR/AcrR family transcriptional regulator [Solirubrobacteraceae bacterium]|nr:TetR/AcrR family transcriptional regulator [Solirubrobacteraceae bacterium]
MSPDTVTESEKPLRADALRNRNKVLAAARTAFAQQGPDVAISEILKLAGVGSGTLFRHFPTKQDLLVAVLEQTFDQLDDQIVAALEDEDPWQGLVTLLTTTAEMQARDAAFLASVGPELFAVESLQQRNERMMVRMSGLLDRAKAAGVVRDDLAAEDLPFLISAIGGATQSCAPASVVGTSPDLWRRYLGFVLDGLRPQGAHPLPQPPPTLAQMKAMKAAKASMRCGAE